MVAAVGAVALGIFLGYLTWYFVVRFKEYSASALASVVGVFAGGTVVAFLGAQSISTSDVLGWYAIGLFLGFVVYSVVAIIFGPDHRPPLMLR
jgi:hypothetical protein